MVRHLESPVVMISGANRGIGRAVALALAGAGYRLSLGARRLDSLVDLEAKAPTGSVLCHRYEARDRRAAEAWVASTQRRFGRVDALVNNAAVFHRFRVEDGDESLLDEMWAVNVKGPLFLFQAVFPHLKTSGRGRVVNIVSLSGKRLKSATAAGYAMTKHALSALNHGIRYSGWEHGIRATAICPGYVDTDMSRALAGIDREEMTAPESVASLVLAVLALPNTASVAELPVNCVLESSY